MQFVMQYPYMRKYPDVSLHFLCYFLFISILRTHLYTYLPRYSDPWLSYTVAPFSIPNVIAIGTAIFATACYAAVLIASIAAIVAYEGSKRELDLLDDQYDEMTVSQSQLQDGILASEANLENSIIFYEWATDTLTKMNQNVISQNNAMAELLQDRHYAMETRLNSYLSCSKSMLCYVCLV